MAANNKFSNFFIFFASFLYFYPFYIKLFLFYNYPTNFVNFAFFFYNNFNFKKGGEGMMNLDKIQKELALLKESGVYVIEEKLDQFARDNYLVLQEKINEASRGKLSVAIWNIMKNKDKEKAEIVILGNAKSLYPTLKKAGYKMSGDSLLEKEIEP
jgi:hypothetical protein